MPDVARAPGSLYWPPVNAEFNWWLLIVGIVVGAGLMFLVVADLRPSQEELDDPAWQDETPGPERPRERERVTGRPADRGATPRPDPGPVAAPPGQDAGTRPTWSATDPSPRRR
jgi:hypothetical protein